MSQAWGPAIYAGVAFDVNVGIDTETAVGAVSGLSTTEVNTRVVIQGVVFATPPADTTQVNVAVYRGATFDDQVGESSQFVLDQAVTTSAAVPFFVLDDLGGVVEEGLTYTVAVLYVDSSETAVALPAFTATVF